MLLQHKDGLCIYGQSKRKKIKGKMEKKKMIIENIVQPIEDSKQKQCK